MAKRLWSMVEDCVAVTSLHSKLQKLYNIIYQTVVKVWAHIARENQDLKRGHW